MINEFKNQTHLTLFHFLTLLGQEADVFSSEERNLCPTLDNENVYIYIKGHELVLVFVDYMLKGTREVADLSYHDPDEKSCFQNVSTPELAHHNLCRTSPVWMIFQAAHSLREFINPYVAEPLDIHAVLVTTSDIINYEELEIAASLGFDDIGITVFHCCYEFFDQWKTSKMPLNTDFFLPGACYLQTYRHQRVQHEEKAFGNMLDEWLEQSENGEDHQDSDDDDIEFDFDNYDFDDDEPADTPSQPETPPDSEELEARIAACRSADVRRRLIVLRAKLAVRYNC